MNLHRNPMASAIALSLACSLVTACGGGGSGVVRSSPPPAAPATPPPASPPAPPPPPTIVGPCQAPITSDCTIATSVAYMGGGRDSAHRLQVGDQAVLQLGGSTNDSKPLAPGTYRFAGGTAVSGTLQISSGNTLVSDVAVIAVGDIWNAGLIRGDIDNRGRLWLAGTVEGNVENVGYFYLLSGSAEHTGWPAFQNTIRGNLHQSAAGTLDVSVPTTGIADYTYTLDITGQAHLGGTLLLRSPGDGWDAYPLPATPTSGHVLHAAGGVFGTFDRWISPGLFIEGSIRYGANDVWFDLTRISVQAAMAGQGFGGITLASAGNLDRALAIADGFTTAPNTSQSRFLRSAGRLLWLGDAQQAARSLDSLAGSLHVDTVGALANDDALARGIGARTLALQPGDRAGAWSRLQGGDTIAGFDHWLSPRLLAGATAAQARDARSDHSGGQSQNQSPQAALYLRWFGNDGWYAGGSTGYAQHGLWLDRRIDLADGGQWNAHAQRRLGIASFDVEAGRRFGSGSMTVAPYLWLAADAIRSEAAIEQGQTGFELSLQANTRASLDAGLGVRIGKRWSVGETGWLAFDADARVRQRLVQAGDPLRAAFIGVPDLWFDVPGHEARNGTWLDLGLRGGFGHGWAWSVGHAGSLTGQANGRRWQVGLARRF